MKYITKTFYILLILVCLNLAYHGISLRQEWVNSTEYVLDPLQIVVSNDQAASFIGNSDQHTRNDAGCLGTDSAKYIEGILVGLTLLTAGLYEFSNLKKSN